MEDLTGEVELKLGIHWGILSSNWPQNISKEQGFIYIFLCFDIPDDLQGT